MSGWMVIGVVWTLIAVGLGILIGKLIRWGRD
jgi:hypothetical protein